MKEKLFRNHTDAIFVMASRLIFQVIWTCGFDYSSDSFVFRVISDLSRTFVFSYFVVYLPSYFGLATLSNVCVGARWFIFQVTLDLWPWQKIECLPSGGNRRGTLFSSPAWECSKFSCIQLERSCGNILVISSVMYSRCRAKEQAKYCGCGGANSSRGRACSKDGDFADKAAGS